MAVMVAEIRLAVMVAEIRLAVVVAEIRLAGDKNGSGGSGD